MLGSMTVMCTGVRFDAPSKRYQFSFAPHKGDGYFLLGDFWISCDSPDAYKVSGIYECKIG